MVTSNKYFRCLAESQQEVLSVKSLTKWAALPSVSDTANERQWPTKLKPCEFVCGHPLALTLEMSSRLSVCAGDVMSVITAQHIPDLMSRLLWSHQSNLSLAKTPLKDRRTRNPYAHNTVVNMTFLQLHNRVYFAVMTSWLDFWVQNGFTNTLFFLFKTYLLLNPHCLLILTQLTPFRSMRFTEKHPNTISPEWPQNKTEKQI